MATAEEVTQIKDPVQQELESQLAVVLEADPLSPALIVKSSELLKVCEYLKEQKNIDYLSNVTGVDYLKENVLEVVYHFYSIIDKTGPIILKCRTEDRDQGVHIPSVTPLWRSAEFQEREVYDLFGILFDGHPDLRRILMWDEFKFYPMRKDYVQEDQDIHTPEEEALLKEAEAKVQAAKAKAEVAK